MKAISLFNVKAVDSYAPLTKDDADNLISHGIEAVARYENISADELALLLNAGLKVFFVVTSPNNNYQPTINLAQTKHRYANGIFTKLGVPNTVSVFVDLEGMGGIYVDQLAYANAAVDCFPSFTPGLYVGAGVGLTGKELYSVMGAKRYWKSGSRCLDRYGNAQEPNCGYALYQNPKFNQTVGSLPHQYDFDYLTCDYRERTVIAVSA